MNMIWKVQFLDMLPVAGALGFVEGGTKRTNLRQNMTLFAHARFAVQFCSGGHVPIAQGIFVFHSLVHYPIHHEYRLS